MLVVVTIMMMLVAAAATQMRPATESRRIREAARALNVYLGSARNRAMETGRPCGVMFHRFAGATSAVMNLDQCEVPPRYAGQQTTSMAKIAIVGVAINVTFCTDASGATAELLPNTTVKPNDLIQFGCQGPTYYIVSNVDGAVDGTTGFLSNVSTVTVALYNPAPGQTAPWSTTAMILSYQILRSPVKSAATPLQLPASTVLDLAYSGVGTDPAGSGIVSFGPGVVNDVVCILFSSNGSVYSVSSAALNGVVTQPIFLLLGKRERVGNLPQTTLTTANDPSWANFQDLNNVWVVINPQTGLVSSDIPTPVSTVVGDPNYVAPTDSNYGIKALGVSRQLARQGVGMGGK
jgi:type II secretory pathway pseudopilin PulG